jgi:hypothetical protein
VTTGCGPRQFALVRVLLGVMLAVSTARMIPYGAELLGADGAFAVTPQSDFPNVLRVLPGRTVPVFLGAMVVLAVLLAAGRMRGITALLLWYGWACLTTRAPYLTVPSDGYVGWLLLAMAVAPSGEHLRPAPGAPVWRLPTALHVGAWTVLALGYLVSGVDKLSSPSWVDGTALRLTMESPIAREWWGADALLALPETPWALATWTVLGLEIAFAPLCCFRVTRALAWTAMVAMHVILLGVLDIAEVSATMLIFHLLVLDPAWLPWRAAAAEDATAPGGSPPGAVLAALGR